MKDGLKFNICDLETSHLFNDQVKDLAHRIKTKISTPLLYSCQFWAAHFLDTPIVQDGQEMLMDEMMDFIYHYFLFWLEVMSLNTEVAAANIAILSVAHHIQLSNYFNIIVCIV